MAVSKDVNVFLIKDYYDPKTRNYYPAKTTPYKPGELPDRAYDTNLVIPVDSAEVKIVEVPTDILKLETVKQNTMPETKIAAKFDKVEITPMKAAVEINEPVVDTTEKQKPKKA